MYCNVFINKKVKKILKNSGFGLIELLVSVSIMVLVIGVVLSQHNAFNGAVLLRGQAYEVALEARNVQLTAVSVAGDGGEFRKVYGLHFTENTDSYQIFQDLDGNGKYDSGEEFGKQGKLDPRFMFENIELVDGAGAGQSNVSVLFERPNFDARLIKSDGFEDTNATAVKIDVRLKGTIGPGSGKIRTVEITKTGQISVI